MLDLIATILILAICLAGLGGGILAAIAEWLLAFDDNQTF
jgi:hypothetical protein